MRISTCERRSANPLAIFGGLTLTGGDSTTPLTLSNALVGFFQWLLFGAHSKL